LGIISSPNDVTQIALRSSKEAIDAHAKN